MGLFSWFSKKPAEPEKPKKKICCACPDTKARVGGLQGGPHKYGQRRRRRVAGEAGSPFRRAAGTARCPCTHPLAIAAGWVQRVRDECTTTHGPEAPQCQKLIEAHKECLRAEGFNVRAARCWLPAGLLSEPAVAPPRVTPLSAPQV